MSEQFKRIQLGLAIARIAVCIFRIAYEAGQSEGFKDGLEAQIEDAE